jgi:hypothetical protein
LLADLAFAQSCPMCKEGVNAAGGKLSEGFYYSILAMIGLPFTIGGTITTIVFKAWWKRTHPDQDIPLHKALMQAWRERKNRGDQD